MTHSEDKLLDVSPVQQFYTAFTRFQSLLTPVPADATNPHLRNRYATVKAMTNHIRGALDQCGLCTFHDTSETDGGVRVTTHLQHSSGYGIMVSTPVMEARNRGAQQMGGLITYGRRYGLMMLGVVCEEDPDDDDGHRAQEAAELAKYPDGSTDEGADAKAVAATVQLALTWLQTEEGADAAAEAWFELSDAEKAAAWRAKDAANPRRNQFSQQDRERLRVMFREAQVTMGGGNGK